MVPTEVLAKAALPIGARNCWRPIIFHFVPFLLTGSMTAKEKRLAREEIESGKAQIVIGTHALIQEKVSISELGLVVTDEQHRFGVRQREMLAEKGRDTSCAGYECHTDSPDVGDHYYTGIWIFPSSMRLPANRLPIKNCVVDEILSPQCVPLYGERSGSRPSGVYYLSHGGGK